MPNQELEIPTKEEFVKAYKKMSDLQDPQIEEIYDILTNPARTEEFLANFKMFCEHVGGHEEEHDD